MSESSQNPIDWETVEDRIRDLACEKIGIDFVWSEQSAPQPNQSFGRLGVVSGPTAEGLDEDRIENEVGTDDVILTTIGVREFTMNFQVDTRTNQPTSLA